MASGHREICGCRTDRVCGAVSDKNGSKRGAKKTASLTTPLPQAVAQMPPAKQHGDDAGCPAFSGLSRLGEQLKAKSEAKRGLRAARSAAMTAVNGCNSITTATNWARKCLVCGPRWRGDNRKAMDMACFISDRSSDRRQKSIAGAQECAESSLQNQAPALS